DLRAVANQQRPRRPNPARLRHQRARLGRGTRKGDFLAGPAALPGERRLPARPVREAHPGGLEGEGDLLALTDGRRRQRALGDGHSVIAFECAGGKCGRGRWGRTITLDHGFDDDEVEYDCEPGPVRVSLTMRSGRVQSLRTYVGGRWVAPPRDAAVTDFGTTSARDPVGFDL